MVKIALVSDLSHKVPVGLESANDEAIKTRRDALTVSVRGERERGVSRGLDEPYDIWWQASSQLFPRLSTFPQCSTWDHCYYAVFSCVSTSVPSVSYWEEGSTRKSWDH